MLEPGRLVTFATGSVAVIDSIPRGHKMALRPIRAGESIIKYGSPIGTASADIRAGAHVHTHNVMSERGRSSVDVGGAIVLGEIAEIMGAEHLLAERAVRPATAAQLLHVVSRVEREAMALGLDIRGTQPSPGNIRGGLTTIEEKSLVTGNARTAQTIKDNIDLDMSGVMSETESLDRTAAPARRRKLREQGGLEERD